ncbi:hypothetical protein SH501x_003380 [Pirellulaceae bacterium SH501]
MRHRFLSSLIIGAICCTAPLCVGSLHRNAIAQETRTVQEWKGMYPGVEVKLDAMGQLQLVDFSKSELAKTTGRIDEALSQLQGQSKLRNLIVGGPGITDAGLQIVANFQNLGALSIVDSPITDQGLVSLQTLTKLKELSLVRLPIGNESLAPLVGNSSLVKLRLRAAANVTDEAINKYLPKFTNIASLELSELAIGDASLDTVSRLPKLVDLNLLRTRVTSAGIKKLTGLPLKKLNLDDIPTIGDEAVSAILAIPTLEFLHLGKTKVTDAGIAKLADLKSLKDLLINDTAVSEKAIADLQAKLPNLKIKSK